MKIKSCFSTGAIVIILLAGLATGCGNPFASKKSAGRSAGKATLTVSFGSKSASGKAARTIVPDLVATASSFTVTLTSESSPPAAQLQSTASSVGSVTIAGVEAGAWDIAVAAKASDGSVIASGSYPGLAVAANSTPSVTVTLSPNTSTGTGSISLAVSVQAAANSLVWNLENSTGDTVAGPSAVSLTSGDGVTYSGTISVANVPTGIYSLVMTIKNGTTSLGTFRESANVYANLTSDRWILSDGTLAGGRTFAANELLDSNGSLSDLVIHQGDSSNIPAFFSSSIQNFSVGTIGKGPTISFTPTSSVDGQTISYVWNSSTSQAIVSGRTSGALAMQSGTNTLAVSVVAPNGTTNTTYTITMNWIPDYSGIEGVKMVPVAGGTFSLCTGSGDYTVTTVSSFQMGKYDVTQAQYLAVVGSNPSAFTGDASRPVEKVSWYDALVFCNRLSMLEGLTPAYTINGSTDPNYWDNVPTVDTPLWDNAILNLDANGYRLPTEAEWRFAAQGGALSKGYSYVGGNVLDDVAWTSGNSGGTTHPVGLKQANELGLYDMSGNVWQWCWDWYSAPQSGAPQSNPTGPSAGSSRITEGGSYLDTSASQVFSSRPNQDQSFANPVLGFRVARSTGTYPTVYAGTSIVPVANNPVTISTGSANLVYNSLATFSSAYGGTASGYQWYLNGAEIPGAVGTSLSITPTTATMPYGVNTISLGLVDTTNGVHYSGSLTVCVEYGVLISKNVYGTPGIATLQLPNRATTVTVKAWGAGGGGKYYYNVEDVEIHCSGAEGGYVLSTYSCPANAVLDIVVGTGGVQAGAAITGVPAAAGDGTSGTRGGGGSVVTIDNSGSYTLIACAGGGGGASADGACIGPGGGNGWNETYDGAYYNFSGGCDFTHRSGNGWYGGWNWQGRNGQDWNPAASTLLDLGGKGGTSAGWGSGGGGYGGGAGGGSSELYYGGGGGGSFATGPGSSYTAGLSTSISDADYVSGVGIGGSSGTDYIGGNGLVVITVSY
jgi:formylglycine-generating enzyme